VRRLRQRPKPQPFPHIAEALDRIPPDKLFGSLDDPAWRWLNVEGPASCPFLATYLPFLPPEGVQSGITEPTGERALEIGFQIYSLFKHAYEEQAGPLESFHRLLDFGCGWGRVTRFFLRDVAPENLVGIDVDERAVAACLESNRWCRFERCETFPPTTLEPASFDLIYAYSVFSHLSEKAHLRWLEEFERLLKPRGILLVTTLARDFIEGAAAWGGEPGWRGYVAANFSPRQDWLAAYDRGEFCFISLPERPHFGFTAIPESFVRKVWSRHFVIRKFERPDSNRQPIIVCRKRDLGAPVPSRAR
jgi:SAM-dependent methyltransferase